jgi:hypothetical protein
MMVMVTVMTNTTIACTCGNIYNDQCRHLLLLLLLLLGVIRRCEREEEEGGEGIEQGAYDEQEQY